MKQKVIEFFQNLPEEKTEQFNEAFSLYRQSPGKNASAERSYNASGYTPHGLENLLYDLQTIHGITDVEKVKVIMEVVKEEQTEITQLFDYILALSEEELRNWCLYIPSDCALTLDQAIEMATAAGKDNIAIILEEELAKVSFATATNGLPVYLMEMPEETLIEWANNLPETDIDAWKATLKQAGSDEQQKVAIIISAELEKRKPSFGQTPDELTNKAAELNAEQNKLGMPNPTEFLNKEAETETTSIREEFPFLNNADCPDELKILVADKITAWKNYVEAQNTIAKADSGELKLTDEALADVAAIATRNFEENQRIYDELNVYKETGKVLGVHPVFKKLQLTREVEAMTNDELIKFKSGSAKYFSDNKKGLLKAQKDKNIVKVAEIEERVAERKDKLFLVNKKLGV
ncbi:hypothetical protein [Flavobacterium denitrificans]|uniref:hypothetical protein n=1 Tax=Flavobacterium denitrificans TaxID=281361 RepID=UPI00040585EA|nr:hypothetical protein [Flavobacterium denitrificans]